MLLPIIIIFLVHLLLKDKLNDSDKYLETGISSGLMGHLARNYADLTFTFYDKYINVFNDCLHTFIDL